MIQITGGSPELGRSWLYQRFRLFAAWGYIPTGLQIPSEHCLNV